MNNWFPAKTRSPHRLNSPVARREFLEVAVWFETRKRNSDIRKLTINKSLPSFPSAFAPSATKFFFFFCQQFNNYILRQKWSANRFSALLFFGRFDWNYTPSCMCKSDFLLFRFISYPNRNYFISSCFKLPRNFHFCLGLWVGVRQWGRKMCNFVQKNKIFHDTTQWWTTPIKFYLKSSSRLCKFYNNLYSRFNVRSISSSKNYRQITRREICQGNWCDGSSSAIFRLALVTLMLSR